MVSACQSRKEFVTHIDELPLEPVACITLKDAEKMIKTCNYPCPQKWKDVWYVLLQQHLIAGRICPSNAPTVRTTGS